MAKKRKEDGIAVHTGACASAPLRSSTCARSECVNVAVEIENLVGAV